MNKVVFFILVLSHWNLWAHEDEPSMHVKYANEVIRSFAEELEQELGLVCIGSGGSMPYDVESISIQFNAYQRATIDQACELEVKVTEKLLKAINNHPRIRPYLREYPVTVPRAAVAISSYKSNGIPYVDGIFVGFIFYCKRDENENLSNLGEEPYEAAFWRVSPFPLLGSLLSRTMSMTTRLKRLDKSHGFST